MLLNFSCLATLFRPGLGFYNLKFTPEQFKNVSKFGFQETNLFVTANYVPLATGSLQLAGLRVGLDPGIVLYVPALLP